jgi:hypothetical protein
MARWEQLVADEPELTAQVKESFDARVHHMLATVRRDGGPRISGTEVIFALGDIWLGSMWNSPKARDLIRDGRYALHSGSHDPPDWTGDAKLAGRAIEMKDPVTIRSVQATRGEWPPGRFHLFRLEIEEAISLRLPDPPEHLVATRWREGGGASVRLLTE